MSSHSVSGQGTPTTLDEFALIRRYFATQTSSPSSFVALGIGDDCALLSVPEGCVLAVSVDTQIPQVHFPADAPPAQIAARALRCAASDLAAMGAEPLGFTLALTLPHVDEAWLSEFSSGLLQTAQQLHCPLVGGDTTRGALCISVSVHGSVPAASSLQRCGATVGDDVWVSGCLGDGAAALALLQKRHAFSGDAASYLMQRFYQPDIDFQLGVQLRVLANSCIDVSDGLLADLGHICTASHVGAQIFSEQLPVSSLWKDGVSTQQVQQWALCGGDDYRLCFTAAPQYHATIAALDNVFCIGKIVAGSGVVVLDDNHQSLTLPDNSYKHF